MHQKKNGYFFLFWLNLDNKCLMWTVHVAYSSQIKLFQRLLFLAKEGEVRIRQHPASFYTTAAKLSKNLIGPIHCSSLLDWVIRGPQKLKTTSLGHLNRTDPGPASIIKSRRERGVPFPFLCLFPTLELPARDLLPNTPNTESREVSGKASRKA